MSTLTSRSPWTSPPEHVELRNEHLCGEEFAAETAGSGGGIYAASSIFGIHASRTACGHRDHRGPDRHPPPCAKPRPRSRPHSPVPLEPPADRPGVPDVREREQGLDRARLDQG